MPLLKKNKTSYNYNQTDKELISALAKKRLPSLKQLKYLNKFLNKKEIILTCLGLALVLSGLILSVGHLYQQKVEVAPDEGGKYIEGSIGSPQFINPIYSSLNEVDADLSKLIYSSLFNRDKNGFLAQDLVDSYTLSPDQKTYTFNLKKNVKWHNGSELKADDVVFTIETIQDSSFHSPLRTSLAGVGVKKIDDYSFSLELPEPFAPFIELLTFGILPKETWEEISPSSMSLTDLNLHPIGSGPYQFTSLTKDKTGLIHAINLEINQDYYGDKPFISKMTFKFFPTSEELISSLNDGQIDGGSYLSNDDIKNINSKNSYNIHKLNLPENTAVVFNLRNKDEFSNIKFRQALAYAINKQKIVGDIFGENAEAVDSPINTKSFGYSSDITKYNYNLGESKKLLRDLGWELKSVKDEDGLWQTKNNQVLSVKLTVPDSIETIKMAEAISSAWQELGIKTDLNIISKNDLNKAISSKNFTAMVYSWSVGMDPDPYVMWHSSQSGERGQNITGYKNEKVDKLLEDGRLTNNIQLREKDYIEFQKIITQDVPAIFLYSPRYIYLQNKRIKGFDVNVVTSPEDRFDNISSWYIKESKSLNFKK
ncbi:MAG: peptide ABC transporter substrate-binding protein [Patescibacteria group bacterium]|nr:peptide ABC transporter substrate-binding protein [Patescibacteria group bacterium]